MLVPVMAVLAVAVAVYTARHGFHDVPVPTPSFLAVPLIGLVLFVLFAGIGLRLRRKAQSHKRLMFLAALTIADAGMGRIEVFHALLPLWDIGTMRRLHPATLWGGGALAIFLLGAVPLGMTPAWLALVKPITG